MPPSTAVDLCAFTDASPSPYHAVAEVSRRLNAEGFTRLDESLAWTLSPGDARYVTRGDASLVAFRVGNDSPVTAGFRIVGAHTDSPNLRLKPQAAIGREGYSQLGVEVYGGVLLHTWLDRDLGIAGRIVTENPDGTLSRHAVRLHLPLARIPSLAIHLDREVNDRGLTLNRQTHMVPILGMGDADVTWTELLGRLAKTVGEDPTRIRGFDLGLYDLTMACISGIDGDYVFSGRLDNLGSTHGAVTALAMGRTRTAGTRVVALFDHEEIGSASAQGASGPFLRDVLGRIVEATDPHTPSGLARALSGSFCVSADMAHAVHPNFSEKHDPRHMPRIGHGPVVKTNAQQRYATDGYSAARFRAACHAVDVPFQDFVSRSDLACGSTIGPITATELGVATVDVGTPMLSMHSAREMCGTADVGPMVTVLRHVLDTDLR